VTDLAWTTLDTPVGPLSLACSGSGLAMIWFSARSGDRGEPASGSATANDSLDAARTQLSEYFLGSRRVFDLAIDWDAVPPPRRQVLSVLFETVQYGETVTYGSLARRAGLDAGGVEGSAPPVIPVDARDIPARAIGRIMGSNPLPLIVPCHRVVAADGLGGYSGGSGSGGSTGIEIKRWLLTFEGTLPATLDWDPSHGPAGAMPWTR